MSIEAGSMPLIRRDLRGWRCALSGLLALLPFLGPLQPAAAGNFDSFDRAYAIVSDRYIEEPKYDSLARSALTGVAELVRSSGRQVPPEILTSGRLPDDRRQALTAVAETLEKVHAATDLPYARLEEAAIQGMLTTLDPHSSLLTSEAGKELQVEIKGTFGGIGLQLTTKDGFLTVIAPIDDTPAFQAGIKPGDRIVKINGVPTVGLSIDDAVKRLRGERGSWVDLAILRAGWDSPRNFELMRNTVTMKSVRSQMLGDGIGYVRISLFISPTAAELESALDNMGVRFGRLKGLVIDLRNNSGGILESVTAVADKFINAETICSIMGRSEKSPQKFIGNSRHPYQHFPLIVLVNEGSASGAEIIAGALQDLNKAVLVGKRTFGKGSVQSIFPLPNKDQLRLTTAQYYLPAGRTVQGGIVPDAEIEEPEGDDLPLRLATATFQAAAGLPDVVTNEQLKEIARKLARAGIPASSSAAPARPREEQGLDTAP